MSFLEAKYEIRTDENGLAVITKRGRCTHDERSGIEANCTKVYEMIRIPNASGAVLKSMDGTQPRIVQVQPPTLTPATYNCVKVSGRVNPFAPAQPTGSPYAAKYILSYEIVYQEVGGVS